MKELLRPLLRSLATMILRRRSQPYKVQPGNRCVVIAPHQDDEALGCAGLILSHRAAHIPVSIVYITDGAQSHPGHPRLDPGSIARIRREEAIRAMQLLGIDSTSLHFLDAPDGTLTHLTSQQAKNLTQRLGQILAALGPTELFITCRDDSSTEHTGAFELTSQALHYSNLHPRLLEYPVWARWRPPHLLRIAKKSRRIWRLSFQQEKSLKRSALHTYASQALATPPWKNAVLPRGFVDCFDSSEEFFFER